MLSLALVAQVAVSLAVEGVPTVAPLLQADLRVGSINAVYLEIEVESATLCADAKEQMALASSRCRVCSGISGANGVSGVV